MNNVSYFDHRVIRSCTLVSDGGESTRWLYGLGRAAPRLSRRNTLRTVVTAGNRDSDSASWDLTALPLNRRSPGEASFPFNINILNEESPERSEALELKGNISRGRRNLAWMQHGTQSWK
ncbi:hypothetical protein AV530_013420 [Patagioenas fasciata monilis]|uniref:Uncharacterized protein n=1 Tax=Patagioenas fasciata monilis TaxID=372326 RepID=A0A1V4JPB7_PATFA|nr:hypothetical protein AV530_013420 [Patagioenas fasciata monilis]